MPLTTKGKLQSILDNLLVYDNNCILVDSATGNDSNSGKNTWNNALATWDAAYAKCTASNGDKILLAPGHAETWNTTGTKVTGNKAGVEVIALGSGADKATITVTHTGATAVFSANNQKVKGVRFVSGVDSITKFITISGNDCEIDVESIDDTDNEYEVITDVINTGDRNKIKVKKQGFITGNANDCIVSCNGCNGADIEIIGDITSNVTAIIEFVTAASSNINIKLFTLVNGITNLSQNVIDTVSGSTYNAKGFDKGAGAYFSGNESGLAIDDASAIKTVVDSILVDTGTTLPSSITSLDTKLDYAIANQSGGFNAKLGKRVSRAKADVLDSVQNSIFDITGDVLITHIEGLIEDGAVDTETVNTQFIWNSTSYGDTNLCAVADLTAAAIGTKLGITGTFTDALQKDANGALKLQEPVTLKGGGSIDIKSSADGGGDNSATVSFIIWYIPLSNDGAISASA